ncbi:hypothetical protein PHET_09521 [Paragonimus heterotremus]|uniref:Ubinuclein middle domain-containing protein n=1 Tax=Paragonimus heterotremus TaxID=100268 RepID=A0A8J4STH6_9TREM|nr:hypothetical protein PHET_09521 [Paragonimus heterotremus]
MFLSLCVNAEPVDTLSVNSDGTAPKRNPKPGAPKKLFRWNTECRNLFQSIIKLRLESYHTLNMKGPREEYLRSLFPTLIQFWPDGWITNAALWRAALPIFQRFTVDRRSHSDLTSMCMCLFSRRLVLHFVSPDHSSTTSPSKLTTLLTTTSTPKPIPSTATQLPTSYSTSSVNSQSIASGNLSSCLSKGKPPQGNNRLTSTSPNVHTNMDVTVSQSRSPIACTSSVLLTVPVSERNGSTQSPTVGNLSGSLTSVAAKVPHPQQAVRSMLQPRPDQPVVERHSYTPKQNTRIGSPPIIHSAVKTTAVKSKTIGSVPITNEARMSLLVQNISAQQLSAPIMSNVTKYSSPSVHVNQTYLMQQKTPDNTARQPSPAVCGSVHLTSTSSVSLADACKPTATVSGKVQRMPDSVDSRGIQYVPHPRRQTEPGVLQKYISLASNSMPTCHLSTLNAANLITQTPASAVQVANSFVSAQGNSAQLYSSSALALATNQINQLQQRAIASTVRPALKMNSTLAAATSVLLQRQPPPAHQQMAPSQGFPQRSTDCYIAVLPSAHASPYTNASHLASSKPPTTSKTYRFYLSCCYNTSVKHTSDLFCVCKVKKTNRHPEHHACCSHGLNPDYAFNLSMF